MNWVVTDDTATATVVWMAAEQIGKTENHEQLEKICDYLVNKHWFQSAADLRSARSETTEWQALEVPGRLKLAIQQVLDQTTPYLESVATYGYEDYYAVVHPSSEADAQQWTEAANGTDGEDQSTTEYYSQEYPYSGNEGPASGQYTYEQTEYSTNPPSYEETYGSSHEAYYSTDTTSTLHENDAAATTLLSLQGDNGYTGTQMNDSDAGEAYEYVESELTCDHPPDAVEHGNSSQTEITEQSGTWSCGQCTYLNSMTSSFCEMCIGHISLSPDIQTTPGTSFSAALLIPAKAVVEVATTLQHAEPLITSLPQHSVMCMLPPVGPLYSPSAPEFDTGNNPAISALLPPPPPYPGTRDVNFLALAFSGSSVPKPQTARPLSSPKSSQMHREDASNFTEYSF